MDDRVVVVVVVVVAVVVVTNFPILPHNHQL
jgi:hypothetical protein